MKKNVLISIFALIAFSLFTLNLAAQNSGTYTFESWDQWATFSNGGFNVYNNIWGSGAGSQKLSANSYKDWMVTANHPNTGGVKSYPNVSKELSINVDDLGSCTSSFSVTRPGSGAYCSAYDIWYNDHSYEVMLWMNKTGAVGPLGAYQTNATIGGHNWNIYKGSNGWNEVFSFIRNSNTNAGTVDIKAISDWLRSNNWFGNVNLHKIEFGFEITSSSGGLDFAVNDYSLSYSEGTGSGGSSGGDTSGGCNGGNWNGGCN